MNEDLRRLGRRSLPPFRALIVGAGAVGQVYGRHLQKAGVVVDVFVRPRRKQEAEDGYLLYRMSPFSKAKVRDRFEPEKVLTSAAEAAAEHYDFVWLCTSTTGLEKGLEGEIGALLGNIGDAKVIVFQPGPQVPEMLRPHLPESRWIDGGISLISYQAPLAGEPERGIDEEGVAYLLPGPSPFSGPGASTVAKLLRKGGMPAQAVEGARITMAFGSATLMPTVVALEGAGWSLKEFRRSVWAKRAADAATEARSITEGLEGQSQPAPLGLLGAGVLRLAAVAAPVLSPFDLQTYLRYHFVKVRDQSEDIIGELIAAGQQQGRPTAALRELQAAVFG